jgi:flavin reductase (DIM6/NTAB) family NADH-FMN oxidoreductase RutF
MSTTTIPFERFSILPHHLWHHQWLLLTCGDFAAGSYNAMTVGWGSFGTMWGRPFAQVVVRPQRYTFEYMERYDTFSLCAFPAADHAALSLLGTQSGRDLDKITLSGLTPTSASCVAAPIYTQAELAIECRKVYWQDLDPAHFVDPTTHKHYPKQDYHRVYFGEILAITGSQQYQVE